MPFTMITVISSSLSVTLEIHIEFLSKNSTTTHKNMIHTISTCLMNNQNVLKRIRRYHIRVFSPQKSFCRLRKRVSKITVESWSFVKYVGDEKPKVSIDIYDAYEDIFICMTPEKLLWSSDLCEISTRSTRTIMRIFGAMRQNPTNAHKNMVHSISTCHLNNENSP